MSMRNWLYHVTRNLFRRRQVDAQLNEELNTYVELLTAEKIRAGMSHESARRAALVEAGGVEQLKEEVRDVWLGARLELVLRDARHSLRALGRAPGFTAAVLLSLGLGVGGTIAIYTVLNAVLLRPLPYPAADRLHEVRVYWDDFGSSLSPADLGALREQQGVAVGAYFYPDDGFATRGANGPEVIEGAVVTTDFLPVLGVQPLLGTYQFAADREVNEAVIGEELWRTRYGSAATVVGSTIDLDGEAFTIIGVMPRGFNVPGQRDGVVWAKFEPNTPTRRGPFYLNGVVRLPAGTATAATERRLTAAGTELLRARFGVTDEWRYTIQPLKDVIVGNIRPTLRLLALAVPLILLIAILNFTNLLLARGLTRRHELGVRAALGAGRGRIAVQLLTEAGMLGVCGGAAGIVVAWGALALARGPASAVVPRMNEVQLDMTMIVLSLLTGLLAGLLAGVLPAVRLPLSHIGLELRERGRSSGPGLAYARARRVLVTSVVAVTLTMVVSAALLVKSMIRLQDVDPGFNPQHVLSFRLNLPDDAYPDTVPARIASFLSELDTRVRTIAGVSDVAFATSLPPNDLWLRNDYTVEGTAPDAAGASNVAAWIPVSESYFDALHIGIVQGRAFSAQDRDGAPAVAIVDEAFVRRHYPDGNATGKRLKGGTWDDSAPWITIVGVARNVSYDGGVWGGGEPTVYTAYTQNLWATTPFVVVRAAGDAGALMTRVRAAVRDIDPSLPLRDVATMEERVHDSMAAPRLRGRLFVLLAGIALALAITGIYGLIAYDVNQHRQDIAVRRAFGAPTGAVVGGVLRSGMQLVAAGGVAGIIGALLAGRLLGSLLYGVTARDVQALVVSCLAIVIAALAACVIPALNAARVDPMRALRQE